MDETRRNAEAVFETIFGDVAPYAYPSERGAIMDALVRFAAEERAAGAREARENLKVDADWLSNLWSGDVLDAADANRLHDIADTLRARLSPAEPKAEPAGGGVERCVTQEQVGLTVFGSVPSWAHGLPHDEPPPATYRAGTRPERIEVGMVLRGPYGQIRAVSDVDEYVWLIWTHEPWRVATRYDAADLADWTLARDWPTGTKPDEAGPNAVSQRETLPNGERDQLDNEDDGGGR